MRKLFLPLLLLVFFACERADEPVIDDTPKLSVIQAQILDLNCAISGCHVGATPPRGLNLEDGNTFSNIVNVASDAQPAVLRVNPGNPDQSYLYLKIIGDASITGSQMPLGRSPLSSEEMELIRDWITEGALDN